MSVPSKVKNSLWRACENPLLAKTNPVRGTVIEDPTGDHCKQTPGDFIHSILLVFAPA